MAKTSDYRIRFNTDRFAASLRKKFEPGTADRRLIDGLLEIGRLVRTKAKANVLTKDIKDQGILLNSLQSRLSKEGNTRILTVGTFGAKYASVNEFGATEFTEKARRAMMADLRKRGRLTGLGKNIVQGNRFIARPFLDPAFDDNRAIILDIMRKFLEG